MAPDDLSSQRDPRTDSSDEQAQMSVTTAERKGISPRNAPSQRRYGSQGKSHTELLKLPTRNQKKSLVCTVPNRREMAALWSRHQQRPPEGKTSCTRNRDKEGRTDFGRIQHRKIRSRRETDNQDKHPRGRRQRT